MLISDIIDRKVAVFGFGVEGQSVVRALRSRGHGGEIHVLVDGSGPQQQAPRVTFVTGPDIVDFVPSLDVLIKSPGVPPEHPAIVAARHASVSITTATNIYIEEVRSVGLKVLGVTGTKGKSTSTTLLHLALKAAGLEAVLVGNIGIPALDLLDEALSRKALSVMEVSSYQASGLIHGPDVGLVLNLFPEHMDWHGGIEPYYNAKLRLAATQDASGYTVYNALDEESQRRLPFGPARHVPFNDAEHVHFSDGWFQRGSTRLFSDKNMLLRGRHNRENVCGVLTAAELVGASANDVHSVLSSFRGLTHRLEDLGVFQGIRWINDSISTTPQSAVAAIEAFSDSIDTLILGGLDRGYDFEPLARAIVRHPLRNVVLLPDSGIKIGEAIEREARGAPPRMFPVADLAEAVRAAASATHRGKTAALSPAAPSYDHFRNFEERGDAFRSLVNDLAI